MENSNYMAVVRALMTDHDYQSVNIRVVDLWMLLSACQSMQIFSALSDASRAYYKDLGKRLQAIVVTIHPEAKELAERGWDTFVSEIGFDDTDHPFFGWVFPSLSDDEPYYGDEEDF